MTLAATLGHGVDAAPDFSAECVQTIQRSRCWQHERISVQDTACGRVLVKGQRPRRGPLRFALLSAAARLTGNPLLRPVPQRGGAPGQATEVRRLQALAAAGVRVPAVLHVATDHVVMQFLAGPSLQHVLTQATPQAIHAFGEGLLALQRVHGGGQCLSQAFARNMLWSGGAVWMIDFEDDPLEVLSLPEAQARDWLAYLFSVVWTINAPRDAVMRRWCEAEAVMAPEVRALVRQAARRVGWLRHLPFQRKPWGRDVVTLQAVTSFLHDWCRGT